MLRHRRMREIVDKSPHYETLSLINLYCTSLQLQRGSHRLHHLLSQGYNLCKEIENRQKPKVKSCYNQCQLPVVRVRTCFLMDKANSFPYGTLCLLLGSILKIRHSSLREIGLLLS